MAWYVCTVNEVGPAADGTETSDPVIYINLNDNEHTFSNTWFYAANGMQDYLLNVGISAIVGNKYVEVAAFPPNAGNTPYTEITRIYERAPLWQPAAPTNLHDASSVTIGWTDHADNEAGFNISLYGTSEGKDNKYGQSSVLDNVTTATLTGLTAGYTYDFTVVAVNAAGQSSGVTVSAAIPNVVVPPTPVVTSITAGVGPYLVGGTIIYALGVAGENFRIGENVQVDVTWGAVGEQPVTQALPLVQADNTGSFRTAPFAGNSGLGFCGTEAQTFTFAVKATGMLSKEMPTAKAGFTCP
jgi:Fibronectin type III domain